MHPIRCLLVASVSLGLAACGGLSRDDHAASFGIDGVACVGTVEESRPAAVAIAADALLDEARAASGKGGICAGRAFVLQQDVRAWRVWDSSRSAAEPGRWWSLARPAGSREAYRQDFAICRSWSALDRLLSCDLKAGAVILVGTTQSADCEEGTYPKSPFNQVYVPGDPSAGQVVVGNCRDEGEWPSMSTP